MPTSSSTFGLPYLDTLNSLLSCGHGNMPELCGCSPLRTSKLQYYEPYSHSQAQQPRRDVYSDGLHTSSRVGKDMSMKRKVLPHRRQLQQQHHYHNHQQNQHQHQVSLQQQPRQQFQSLEGAQPYHGFSRNNLPAFSNPSTFTGFPPGTSPANIRNHNVSFLYPNFLHHQMLAYGSGSPATLSHSQSLNHFPATPTYYPQTLNLPHTEPNTPIFLQNGLHQHFYQDYITLDDIQASQQQQQQQQQASITPMTKSNAGSMDMESPMSQMPDFSQPPSPESCMFSDIPEISVCDSPVDSNNQDTSAELRGLGLYDLPDSSANLSDFSFMLAGHMKDQRTHNDTGKGLILEQSFKFEDDNEFCY